jgi:hypothetical protein
MIANNLANAKNDQTGLILKVLTVLLVLYFLFCSQWVGILVVLSAWIIDILIAKVKIDSLGSLVKLFIIFQGLTIWCLSSSNVMKLNIFSSTASYLVFNRNFDENVSLSFKNICAVHFLKLYR